MQSTTVSASLAASSDLSPQRARAVAARPPGVVRRGRPSVCVLEHLDGCLSGLSKAEARLAVARCRAPKVVLSAGAWAAPTGAAGRGDWIGLLVLQGLLTRTVEINGLRAQELLGPGDILRPWDESGVAGSLAVKVSWNVLDRASVAVLDGQFATTAARWPSVVSSLISSAVHRSHTGAILLAAVRARRAETRLLLLFWHLADRWGRVGPDGVVIPLKLTHGRLAELVCLRRPTVSAALARLRDAGTLARRPDDFWVLDASSLQDLSPDASDGCLT